MKGILAWHLGRSIKTGLFELNSGRQAYYRIDADEALSQPGALKACAGAVAAELLPGVDALGGPPTGADAIAIATAAFAGIRWFRPGDGLPPEGATIAVVDDVLTTGGSVLQVVRACQEAGHAVAQVIVLVDRQEGGWEEVHKVVPCTALFKVRDLWQTG